MITSCYWFSSGTNQIFRAGITPGLGSSSQCFFFAGGLYINLTASTEFDSPCGFPRFSRYLTYFNITSCAGVGQHSVLIPLTGLLSAGEFQLFVIYSSKLVESSDPNTPTFATFLTWCRISRTQHLYSGTVCGVLGAVKAPLACGLFSGFFLSASHHFDSAARRHGHIPPEVAVTFSSFAFGLTLDQQFFGQLSRDVSAATFLFVGKVHAQQFVDIGTGCFGLSTVQQLVQFLLIFFSVLGRIHGSIQGHHCT